MYTIRTDAKFYQKNVVRGKTDTHNSHIHDHSLSYTIYICKLSVKKEPICHGCVLVNIGPLQHEEYQSTYMQHAHLPSAEGFLPPK